MTPVTRAVRLVLAVSVGINEIALSVPVAVQQDFLRSRIDRQRDFAGGGDGRLRGVCVVGATLVNGDGSDTTDPLGTFRLTADGPRRRQRVLSLHCRHQREHRFFSFRVPDNLKAHRHAIWIQATRH
jgi:hypothetical protein